MSTKFIGYVVPRRNLWPFTQALRSYYHAAHRYAMVAMLLAIAHDRRIKRLGVDGHTERCATRFLGTCTCSIRNDLDGLREYVTGKQRELNGVEAQFIASRRGYVMRLVGCHWWESDVPDALMEDFGVREIHYIDSTDVPPEDKPNRKIARLLDNCVQSGRYFVVPLLTLHEIECLYWDLHLFFGRMYRERKQADAA